MLVVAKSTTVKKCSIHQNEIFLKSDGIIHKVFRGDQTAESIKKIRIETEKLVARLKADKKSILILVDLTQLGKTTLAARNEEIQFIKSLDFDKAAVFGQDFFNRRLVEIIVIFSGMEYKIKFFNDKKQACEWLTSNW